MRFWIAVALLLLAGLYKRHHTVPRRENVAPENAAWKRRVLSGEVCLIIARYNLRNPEEPIDDCGCTDTTVYTEKRLELIDRTVESETVKPKRQEKEL